MIERVFVLTHTDIDKIDIIKKEIQKINKKYELGIAKLFSKDRKAQEKHIQHPTPNSLLTLIRDCLLKFKHILQHQKNLLKTLEFQDSIVKRFNHIIKVNNIVFKEEIKEELTNLIEQSRLLIKDKLLKYIVYMERHNLQSTFKALLKTTCYDLRLINLLIAYTVLTKRNSISSETLAIIIQILIDKGESKSLLLLLVFHRTTIFNNCHVDVIYNILSYFNNNKSFSCHNEYYNQILIDIIFDSRQIAANNHHYKMIVSLLDKIHTNSSSNLDNKCTLFSNLMKYSVLDKIINNHPNVSHLMDTHFLGLVRLFFGNAKVSSQFAKQIKPAISTQVHNINKTIAINSKIELILKLSQNSKSHVKLKPRNRDNLFDVNASCLAYNIEL